MKISEGITCGFKQHAVSIDLDKGTFLPLGNVGKTIVVTPDLDQTESHH
jgi:RNA polymerase III RPC4